jgi:hypothetical protein
MATDRNTQRYTVDETALHVTSVFTKKGEHAVLDHTADADEEVLVALGYKQEFKRSPALLSSPRTISLTKIKTATSHG